MICAYIIDSTAEENGGQAIKPLKLNSLSELHNLEHELLVTEAPPYIEEVAIAYDDNMYKLRVVTNSKAPNGGHSGGFTIVGHPDGTYYHGVGVVSFKDSSHGLGHCDPILDVLLDNVVKF